MELWYFSDCSPITSMTSLAEQLQQLAAPQTTIYAQEKHRASFLFDRKEAANYDFDAIYSLGMAIL